MKEISTKKGTLTLEVLGEKHLLSVLELQSRVLNGIEDKTTYFPLTREELLEGFEKDRVIGVFDADRLVAFSLVISNRCGGLWEKLKEEYHFDELITFDAVVVDPEYRGLGLQRILLDEADKEAARRGVRAIAATVSPKNAHSIANFESAGFVSLREIKAYGGLDRKLMIKRLTK